MCRSLLQPETAWAGHGHRSVFLAIETRRLRDTLEAALRHFHASMSAFANPQECLATLARQPCDLLIIDMAGDAGSGLRLLMSSHQASPWVPCLAVVRKGDVSMAVKAMKAGASDCIEDCIDAGLLCTAMEAVLYEYTPRSARPTTLTKTERLVLRGILEGKTSGKIAGTVSRSKRTIEVHRRNIMRKLDASNVVDLVRLAARMGPVTAASPFLMDNPAMAVGT